MKSSSEVVALIPAFNEEKNIGEVVTRTQAITGNIVVVDDGSADNTHSIAERSGATVIRHTVNLGKGMALRTGVDFVLKSFHSAKYVVIIDSDLQFRPEEATDVLKPLVDGVADVVMGYRDFSKVPFRHRLGNFVWKTAFNLLFGTRLRDTNCGYVALSARAAREIDFHGGYIIESHLLADAIKKKLRISQVLVTVDYSHVSAIPRGIRVEVGVLLFIIFEGLKYRLLGR